MPVTRHMVHPPQSPPQMGISHTPLTAFPCLTMLAVKMFFLLSPSSSNAGSSPFSPGGWTTGQHAPAAPSSPLWSGELHGWALLRLSTVTAPAATRHTVQSGECQQQVAPLVQGCRPSKATSSPAFFKALLYALATTRCVRAAQGLRGFGFEGTFSSSR